MVSSVISTIMDSVSAVFTGLGTSLTTLWESLIYGEIARDAGVDTILNTADDIVTIGLTPFAEWMLIFVGFAIGTGILYAVLRKVI